LVLASLFLFYSWPSPFFPEHGTDTEPYRNREPKTVDKNKP